MAKPLRITIDVEEIAFGRVFRWLDQAPGVVRINIEGTGAKQNNDEYASQSDVAPPRTMSARDCVLLSFKKTDDVMHRTDITKQMVANGFAASTLNGLLSSMTKTRMVTSIGAGKYKLGVAGKKELQNGIG